LATAIGFALSRSGFQPRDPWPTWDFIGPSNNFAGIMAKVQCPHLSKRPPVGMNEWKRKAQFDKELPSTKRAVVGSSAGRPCPDRNQQQEGSVSHGPMPSCGSSIPELLPAEKLIAKRQWDLHEGPPPNLGINFLPNSNTANTSRKNTF
jgi:hypothetical protein